MAKQSLTLFYFLYAVRKRKVLDVTRHDRGKRQGSVATYKLFETMLRKILSQNGLLMLQGVFDVL